MRPVISIFFLLFFLPVWAQKKLVSSDNKNELIPAGITATITKSTVIIVGGKKIEYAAYSGFLSLQNDTGKLVAKVFFTYYKTIPGLIFFFCYDTDESEVQGPRFLLLLHQDGRRD